MVRHQWNIDLKRDGVMILISKRLKSIKIKALGSFRPTNF